MKKILNVMFKDACRVSQIEVGYVDHRKGDIEIDMENRLFRVRKKLSDPFTTVPFENVKYWEEEESEAIQRGAKPPTSRA